VLSRDQFNDDGPLVMRRVLRRFVRLGPVLEVHVGGQVIGTTAEHPFFVKGKGWTPAQELRSGDRIRLEAPGWLSVEDVVDCKSLETVYNFEVEEDHTYFVGCDEWGFAVWAHNAKCVPDVNEDAAKFFFAKIKAGEPVVLKGTGDSGKVYYMAGERLKSGKPYVGSSKREVGTGRRGKDRMEDADHRKKTVDGQAPSARVIAENLTPQEKLGVEGILVHFGGTGLSNGQKAIRIDEVKNQTRVTAGNKLLSDWFKLNQ